MEGCRGNGTDRFGCQGLYHSQGDVYVPFDAALDVGIWIQSNVLGCCGRWHSLPHCFDGPLPTRFRTLKTPCQAGSSIYVDITICTTSQDSVSSHAVPFKHIILK
ncbi:hypothetical protein I7I48_09810 [Histoplasma ohiense]|nr:hypothetical protein I7I48_09810 [Histoplasma ohiense (nom. inval.)]